MEIHMVRNARLRFESLETRATPSAPYPIGSEFQVNTFAPGLQAHPTTARSPNGDFVITWLSDGQDESGYGVYAQRFDAAGTPLGAEFGVNAYTTGDQRDPSIAMDASGDFVIAWQGWGASGEGIYARRFDAAGTPQGGDIRVNGIQPGYQSGQAVAMDAVGNFVVTWISDDGNLYGIYARRYDATGIPQGGQFLVNAHSGVGMPFQSNQTEPAIGMSATGEFVIAWQSQNAPGDDEGIWARRFSATGVPIGGDFHVNTVATHLQGEPAVAMNSAGDFVISWTSLGQESPVNPNAPWNSAGIYAQRYNAVGAPQGGEFHVNTFTTGQQFKSRAAMAADGRFTVTWVSDGQDGSSFGSYAQSFTAAGLPDGGEFRANTTTAGLQAYPSLAYDANANLVIAWASPELDAWGVFAQLYSATAPAPPAGMISISDVTVSEGHSGTISANFTVSLSSASSDTVTVQYLTANNTALAGSDYQSTGGTVTFLPGQLSQVVSVPVIGDRIGELTELFFVNLSNPVNADINDGQAVGQILTDEPLISINDVGMTEGNSGTKLFTFTVTIFATYDQTVTVSYRTTNGTAISSGGGADYVAKTGTLTLNPGETSNMITILVKGDKKRESNETFNVELFNLNSNAMFADAWGLGTILNDD
jgi:hypothetical protein